eukprot:Opistho-2@13140
MLNIENDHIVYKNCHPMRPEIASERLSRINSGLLDTHTHTYSGLIVKVESLFFGTTKHHTQNLLNVGRIHISTSIRTCHGQNLVLRDHNRNVRHGRHRVVTARGTRRNQFPRRNDAIISGDRMQFCAVGLCIRILGGRCASQAEQRWADGACARSFTGRQQPLQMNVRIRRSSDNSLWCAKVRRVPLRCSTVMVAGRRRLVDLVVFNREVGVGSRRLQRRGGDVLVLPQRHHIPHLSANDRQSADQHGKVRAFIGIEMPARVHDRIQRWRASLGKRQAATRRNIVNYLQVGYAHIRILLRIMERDQRAKGVTN